MNIDCYICSKKGNFRENNEDNIYANGTYLEINHNDTTFEYKCRLEDNPIFGVFDGLGGEEKGEIASYKAAEALDIAGCFESYFNIANERICNIEKTNSSKQVGSTAAIIGFTKEGFKVANIGDSRIYHIRNNDISMLSVDHTMIETMIASNIITREEAEKSPYKNCLTQCLGMAEKDMKISPYISEFVQLKVGDIFIICSDGLSGTLTSEEILNIIIEDRNSINIAENLVDKAYEIGTKDNTTVIVLYIKDSGFSSAINEFIKKFRS